MRRVLVAAVAASAMALSGAASGTNADAAKPPPPASKNEGGGLREAKGKIQEVDAQKNRVTLGPPRSEEKPLTLQVDKTTTIFIDGRVGTLDEVKAGSEVRASYEFRDGSNRAQWIEVNRKSKKSSEKSETMPEAPAPSGSPSPSGSH